MASGVGENRNNIVLTGLARSGTTLACQLLNKLPGTVALVEPISPNKYADLPDHEAMAEGIERYFKDQRRMALRKGRVTSKHVGGAVPDNTYENASSGAPRRKVSSKGDIPVGKELGRDFDLVIKQPGLFTALLPALSGRFPCYALIRNPLSVMASGSTIRTFGTGAQRDQKRKHPPTMPRFNEDLATALAERKGNRMERRLYLLSWQFERFRDELPESHVIRYEDVVASKGRALSMMVPAAEGLDEPLKSKNLNELYDRDQMLKFGEALLESDGAYWDFYARADVEEILGQLEQGGPQGS